MAGVRVPRGLAARVGLLAVRLVSEKAPRAVRVERAYDAGRDFLELRLCWFSPVPSAATAAWRPRRAKASRPAITHRPATPASTYTFPTATATAPSPPAHRQGRDAGSEPGVHREVRQHDERRRDPHPMVRPRDRRDEEARQSARQDADHLLAAARRPRREQQSGRPDNRGGGDPVWLRRRGAAEQPQKRSVQRLVAHVGDVPEAMRVNEQPTEPVLMCCPWHFNLHITYAPTDLRRSWLPLAWLGRGYQPSISGLLAAAVPGSAARTVR